jgi:hypothetical protein
MQFIKLWSSAECFFAIDKEEVTELNARGIAVMLTFVVSLNPVKDYVKLRRRLKDLYDLRSKAIHTAQFDHIDISDLNDLSHWVAGVIVSMMSLSERGYKLLRAVHDEIARVDTRAMDGTI